MPPAAPGRQNSQPGTSAHADVFDQLRALYEAECPLGYLALTAVEMNPFDKLLGGEPNDEFELYLHDLSPLLVMDCRSIQVEGSYPMKSWS